MSWDGKYGTIHTDKKALTEDEPCFILRGQDQLAAEAVRFYADLREKAGDAAGAAECRAAADRMEQWPVKKMPD